MNKDKTILNLLGLNNEEWNYSKNIVTRFSNWLWYIKNTDILSSKKAPCKQGASLQPND